MSQEDSEEMLQMRDLFANTHPYLLGATIVVSFLHIIFGTPLPRHCPLAMRRSLTVHTRTWAPIRSCFGPTPSNLCCAVSFVVTA